MSPKDAGRGSIAAQRRDPRRLNPPYANCSVFDPERLTGNNPCPEFSAGLSHETRFVFSKLTCKRNRNNHYHNYSRQPNSQLSRYTQSQDNTCFFHQFRKSIIQASRRTGAARGRLHFPRFVHLNLQLLAREIELHWSTLVFQLGDKKGMMISFISGEDIKHDRMSIRIRSSASSKYITSILHYGFFVLSRKNHS